ncbi:MAG: hypothetical protein ACRD0V_03015 [Acidimicrobiales bacterium]
MTSPDLARRISVRDREPAVFGWWWADPLAGLAIVYVAAREGIDHWRFDVLDDCCL